MIITVFTIVTYANSLQEDIMKNENIMFENKAILVSEANLGFQRDIKEVELRIARKQSELDATLKNDRVRYSNKPLKLAEKEMKYKQKLEELDLDKKELQFRKNNVELLTRIEEKSYQIELEKRKRNTDWTVLERLMVEKDTLKDEYEAKKISYLYK